MKIGRNDPSLIGKSVHQIRKHYAEIHADQFSKSLAKEAMQKIGLDEEDMRFKRAPRLSDLNDSGELPFQILAMDVTEPKTFLESKRKHMDNFRKDALWLLEAAGRDKCAIPFRCERKRMVLHNIKDLSVSGQKFHLCDENKSTLYLDSWPVFLAAAKKQRCGGEECRDANADAVNESALQTGRRFARISAAVLAILSLLRGRDWRLYVAMCLHCNFSTRVLYRGQRKLATYAKISQSYVPDGLRRLEEWGLVKAKKGRPRERFFYSLPLPATGSYR